MPLQVQQPRPPHGMQPVLARQLQTRAMEAQESFMNLVHLLANVRLEFRRYIRVAIFLAAVIITLQGTAMVAQSSQLIPAEHTLRQMRANGEYMKFYLILISFAVLVTTVFAASGVSQIRFNNTNINFSQTRLNVTIGTYNYAHYSGVDVRHITVLVKLVNGTAGNTSILMGNATALFNNGITITSNSTNPSGVPPFSQEFGIQISNFTIPGNYTLVFLASGADPSANATLRITVPAWKHTQMVTVTTILQNTTTTELPPANHLQPSVYYLLIIIIILIVIAILAYHLMMQKRS